MVGVAAGGERGVTTEVGAVDGVGVVGGGVVATGVEARGTVGDAG